MSGESSGGSIGERPSALARRRLAHFARRIGVLAAIAILLLLLAALVLSISEHHDLLVRLPLVARHGGHRRRLSQPRTTTGQVIHVALIVVGVGTLFYALAIVAEFFAAGHLGEVLAGGARRG